MFQTTNQMEIDIGKKSAEQYGRYSQNNLFVTDLPENIAFLGHGLRHRTSQFPKCETSHIWIIGVYHCLFLHIILWRFLGWVTWSHSHTCTNTSSSWRYKINQNIQFSDHLLVTVPASPDFVGKSSSSALALHRSFANPSRRLHKSLRVNCWDKWQLYSQDMQPTRGSFFLSRGNEVLGDYTMYMLYDTQENMRYSMTSTTAISFLAHHILLNETSGLRIGQAQAYPIFHLASPFEVKPGWLTMSGYISYCLTTNWTVFIYILWPIVVPW